jgi:predicted HicB family RNase H-like nuclease
MANKKEDTIYVRVSPQEKEKLARAAEREGMTFSEWVRWVLRKEARKQEETDKDNSPPAAMVA